MTNSKTGKYAARSNKSVPWSSVEPDCKNRKYKQTPQEVPQGDCNDHGRGDNTSQPFTWQETNDEEKVEKESDNRETHGCEGKEIADVCGEYHLHIFW